ncbi:MAG: molybdopterin-guanine dinucleotide biosynthesis protein B [Pseudomonadota bacterium]
MKVWGIAGWKNAGKTTLVERLLVTLTASGLRVSTVKHTHHAVDLDRPGKDSFRHRSAGAQEVIVASGARWALLHELRGAAEPPLRDLLARLAPVDLVLVEGYKHAPHPKIEVWRGGEAPIALTEPSVRAVASPEPPPDIACPWLRLDDTDAIAAFIRRETGLD